MSSAPTPSAEVPAPLSVAVPAPPSADQVTPDAPPPAGRSLLRRRGLWWGVAAALFVAGDAVLFSLISGWREEAADLQTRGHDLGERISIANAIGDGQQMQIDLLTAQSEAAATALAALETSADEEEASAHEYRDVALGYQACYDARGEAIAMAWAGAPVAGSLAAASAACAAADASSATLAAGG